MAVAILLIGGALIEILCALGVLLGKNPYSRLHFLGPANILGGGLIVTAVIAKESLSQAGIKAILIFLVLLATGPIVSHAIARAVYVRHGGESVPGTEEKN